MKRIWILLTALLIIVFLCCSCEKTEQNETSDSRETVEEVGEQTRETTSAEETNDADATASSSTDTTEPPSETFEIMGPYENICEERPFESFMEFQGDRGCYVGKSSITQYELQAMVRVRVVGMKEGDYNRGKWSVYYVQVTEIYGENYSFEVGEIYTMAYSGTPEHPLYGRPPLEIGKEYLRLYTPYSVESEELNIGPTLMMPIENAEGIEYVYGYGIDFEGLDCAIAITDEEENQIYKPGKHDGMIAQVLADEEELPTFDYKCELSALLEELFDFR